jgi:hypothetical protein
VGVLKAAVLSLAMGLSAIALVESCQALVPPGQYFNSAGITTLVSYGTSAPPTLLTAAGDGALFYAEGATVFRLSTVEGASPEVVPLSLTAAPTAMAFDGVGTMAYCSGGALGAFDAATLSSVALPLGLPSGCIQLAITPDRIVYSSSLGGGFVVTAPLGVDASGGVLQIALVDAGGVDPSHASVGIAGDTAYYVWRTAANEIAGLYALGASAPGKIGGCKVADIGYPSTPKMVVFDAATATGAMTSIILRSNLTDTLRRVDLPDPATPPCCKGVACLRDPIPAAEQAPGGIGDFTVSGGTYYWSGSGEVHEAPAANVTPDGGVPDAAPLVDIGGGAPVPSIAVTSSYVYFVVESAILRAPLGQTD